MSLEAFVMRKEMRKDLTRLEAKVQLLERQVSDLIAQRHDLALGRESTAIIGRDRVLVDPAHSAG